jgi:hypothetical protein
VNQVADVRVSQEALEDQHHCYSISSEGNSVGVVNDGDLAVKEVGEDEDVFSGIEEI